MEEDPIAAAVDDTVNGCFRSLLFFFSVMATVGSLITVAVYSLV